MNASLVVVFWVEWLVPMIKRLLVVLEIPATLQYLTTHHKYEIACIPDLYTSVVFWLSFLWVVVMGVF